MSLYLGIDGGGTKTVFALADEQQILATVIAPGSNIVRLGEAKARAALHQGLRQIMVAGCTGPDQITRTCAGVGGAGRPEMAEAVGRIIGELIPGPVEVVGDMVIAHHAAFGSGAGVVVISGTGSIAYGRSLECECARAGGWGPAISDEGSGGWIGRTALSEALRARDAGEDPELLRAILAAWNLASFDELVRLANATPSPNFATLFPAVLKAAGSGDAAAEQVLDQAGVLLAGLGESVMQRLFDRDAAAPVAMCGGVFTQAGRVRESFRKELLRRRPNVTLEPEPVEPVKGALERARAGRG